MHLNYVLVIFISKNCPNSILQILTSWYFFDSNSKKKALINRLGIANVCIGCW